MLQQFAPQLWIQADSLFARQGFTIFLVVLPDVHVRLALEGSHANQLILVQCKLWLLPLAGRGTGTRSFGLFQWGDDVFLKFKDTLDPWSD